MPQERKNQTTRLSQRIYVYLAWLGVAAALAYLVWRFVQAYLLDLSEHSAGIEGLIRYFLGVLLEFLLVWGVAYLNFRVFFLRIFGQTESGRRHWYWLWLAALALGWFAILEWRTDYTPEYVDENVLLTLLIIGFIIAYTYTADYFRTRRLQLALLKDKSVAELHVLKAQLKPHFLFNTLNVLYNSAQKHDDEPTASMILELAQLLRFSIQEATAEFTDLSQELAFIQRYIQFQRLRLPPHERIDVQVDIQGEAEGLQIPPLLLIPFVENAFQYGISLNESCFVHLNIRVQEQRLTMHLQNSIASNAVVQKGLGTGIRNARERMALLYPQGHQLDIKAQDNMYTVDLRLDLNRP